VSGFNPDTATIEEYKNVYLNDIPRGGPQKLGQWLR
jgi:hypothetical protein